MSLKEIHELVSIQFRGSIYQKFPKCSRPRKSHCHHGCDGIVGSFGGCHLCRMKVRGPINDMVQMKGLSILVCPGESIYGYPIIKVQIIFQGTWSGCLRLGILNAHCALEISRSLYHPGAKALLEHDCTHSLSTGVP